MCEDVFRKQSANGRCLRKVTARCKYESAIKEEMKTEKLGADKTLTDASPEVG